MQIFDTRKESEEEIRDLVIGLDGIRYIGHGELKWNPVEGFKFNVPLTRVGEFGPREISIGGGGPVPKHRIRFKISNTSWKAFCTNAFVSSGDRLQIILNHKLTVDVDNLVLLTSTRHLPKGALHSGACTFLLGSSALLPDYVEKKITLDDEILAYQKTQNGILYRDKDLEIIGFLDEDRYLEVKWRYLSNRFSKPNDWPMAIAIRDALSICTGSTVRLLKREILRPTRTYVEFITKRPVQNLGYFSPIQNDGFVDKRLFGNLLRTLLTNGVDATLCRNLFYNIADAMNTRNHLLMGFWIASSLEAFLRTFENKPRTGSRSTDRWQLDRSLKYFQERYLSGEKRNEWKKVCTKVKQHHAILRNKAGHPDWLAPKNPIKNDKSREAYNQMEFLCRFYGYLILAIAGYQGLESENLKA